MNLVKRFLKEEKGLETVEWSVIAALIVVSLIVAIGNLGGAVKNHITTLTNTVTGN